VAAHQGGAGKNETGNQLREHKGFSTRKVVFWHQYGEILRDVGPLTQPDTMAEMNRFVDRTRNRRAGDALGQARILI
jgi:hypothetical protein